MNTLRPLVLLFSLLAPQIVSAGAVHKYWVCGVTDYRSIVGGKSQIGQCRANTAYSQPPCREFVVEYEGDGGVHPGASYSRAEGAGQTRIAIENTNGQHTYTHAIDKAGDTWVYNGKCNYFEAPADKKIFMDYGLKTAP